MYLPTHPTSGEQPSGVGIHGISARKVYPLWLLPATDVGSYPTFSPLPFDVKSNGGNFLWHYLVPVKYQEPAVNRCVALCCPDFPTLATPFLQKKKSMTGSIAKLAVKQRYW